MRRKDVVQHSNIFGDMTSRSRDIIRPSFANSSAQKLRALATLKQGRGECRVPVAPAARVQRVESTRSHRDHPAFPHAMVLTGSFALSPVTGLFVTVAP
jgi:hypothetical protein